MTGCNGHGQNIETIRLRFGSGSSPHFVRFSNSGAYAYISRLGDGRFDVVRASDRKVVSSILLDPPTEFKGNINPALPGGGGVHDAVPNADGSVVLATHWGTNLLYKLVGSEASERWAVESKISVLGRRPIGSVFDPTGTKVHIGLAPSGPEPSGLAVVDVASMTVTRFHTTDGVVPCTQQNSRNGVDAYIITVPGHFYHLNMVTMISPTLAII